METKYVVVHDYQQGSFGTGRAYTVKEWREQAIEWADADGNEELVEAAKKLKDNHVMAFVGDIWQIEFGKLIVVSGKNYAWTACPSKTEKSEITIYPLDEDYETVSEEQVVYSPLTVDEIDEKFITDIIKKTLDKNICL